MEDTGISGKKTLTCRKSLTNIITLCCIEYTSPSAGFELTSLVKQQTLVAQVVVNSTTIRSRPRRLHKHHENMSSLFFEHVFVIILQILGLTASPGTNKAVNETAAIDHLRNLMVNMDVARLSTVRENQEELLEYTSTPAKGSIIVFVCKLQFKNVHD